MKRALVCGAGGFIGGHLVKHLRREGYWVRGVDLKLNEWANYANDFMLHDLRSDSDCLSALRGGFDEVYQLAADMGGMGFISQSETDIMYNNALINLNMIEAAAAREIPRYFFSSSVCVYRDMAHGERALLEQEAYPAEPDNEYGWEKLYAERVALTYARHNPIQVRIARFENCYGPEGTWRGGREKAPAALCRKVAEAPSGGTIDVWGDGSAVRSFIYVDDLIDGILTLMQSDEIRPTNIGTPERVTVEQLAQMIIDISGKQLSIQHVVGPVGVRNRNFSHRRIEALGWQPHTSLREGLELTYAWIARQVAETSVTA